MWKRLNNRGNRSMAIGDPVLHVTTSDPRDYPGGGSLEVQSPSDRYRNPPPRPQREESKGLPNLPFEALPPTPLSSPEYQQYPDYSQYRPASSIYSEAMPPPPNTRPTRDSLATVTTTYTEEEISPPSSPEMRGSRRSPNANAEDDDVSPIDETPDISQLSIRPGSRLASNSKPPASHIPTLRREKRRNQVTTAATNLVTRKEVGGRGRQVHDPRWDPYSGEITTSEKGKPQSVKPGQFAPPALRSTHKPTGLQLGNDTEITAGNKAQSMSFGDRVRNLNINKKQPPPSDKPGWKGASGRVTLVNPVEDRADLKPLSIPRKSSRRVPSSSPIVSPIAESPVSAIRRDETNPFSHSSDQLNTWPVHSGSGRDTPRTTSPLSVIQDPVAVPTSNAVKTTSRSNNPFPREVPETNIPRNDTVDTIDRVEQNFRQALAESFPETKDPYVEPPSRFSVTTYAPSEAFKTPRPSIDTWERPAMPSPPRSYTAPVEKPSPILNRKRPQVLGSGETHSVQRKAIPHASPVFISMSSSLSTRNRASTASLSKNLPQTPTERSSSDLITSLQAQIENLQHRRSNITKSIRQMTELMPQDGLLRSEDVRRKREVERKKVEGLRAEEADIRQEEHELGLKLHRAYKRRDQDAVYEPTTLWVRRVTG